METIPENDTPPLPKDKLCYTCLFFGRASGACAITRTEKDPKESCAHWADRVSTS